MNGTPNLFQQATHLLALSIQGHQEETSVSARGNLQNCNAIDL